MMATREDCAHRLKVLADENRLAVLRALLEAPAKVGALAAALGIEQTLLSHHLRTLRDAGLVVTERQGKAVEYRLADGVAAMSGGHPAIDIGCCKLLLD